MHQRQTLHSLVLVMVKAPAPEQLPGKPANEVSAQVEEQRPPAGIQGLPEVAHEPDGLVEPWLKPDAPCGFQLIHHLCWHMAQACSLHLLPVVAVNRKRHAT